MNKHYNLLLWKIQELPTYSAARLANLLSCEACPRGKVPASLQKSLTSFRKLSSKARERTCYKFINRLQEERKLTPMVKEKLTTIQNLLDSATVGPWSEGQTAVFSPKFDLIADLYCDAMGNSLPERESNTKLIVETINLFPTVLYLLRHFI